ncbi:hypothetical protein [Prosthecobacter algae]|uniref:hypothetical protein n=1 Tax=Prosthecobacter algae TaxID=1144682 RepID=UPI0031E8EAB1
MPEEKAREHLPRLNANAYRGRSVIHWTLTMDQRATGWLSEKFHEEFRWALLHGCSRYEVACPLYCLMPDHAHLLVVGWTAQADQRRFISFLRQKTEPLLVATKAIWQKQPYDHVLRPQESDRYAFEALAHYIAENPVRAGLVSDKVHWPFRGCMIPGYPELTPSLSDYWLRYWRLMAYQNGRMPP